LSYARAGTEVWLDDVRIQGLVDMSIDHDLGDLPIVTLSLRPNDLKLVRKELESEQAE
jgi:hypothetical protein